MIMRSIKKVEVMGGSCNEIVEVGKGKSFCCQCKRI